MILQSSLDLSAKLVLLLALSACGPKSSVSLTTEWVDYHSSSSLNPLGPAITQDGRRLWAEADRIMEPTRSHDVPWSHYPLAGGYGLAWLTSENELCLAGPEELQCALSGWSGLLDATPWGLRVSRIGHSPVVWREGRSYTELASVVQWVDGWQSIPLPESFPVSALMVPVADGALTVEKGHARVWKTDGTQWDVRDYQVNTAGLQHASLTYHEVAAWMRVQGETTTLVRYDLASGTSTSTLLELEAGTFSSLRVSGERWAVVRTERTDFSKPFMFHSERKRVFFGEQGRVQVSLPALFKSTLEAVGDEIWMGIGEALIRVGAAGVRAEAHTPGRMIWPAKVDVEAANCRDPTLTWRDEQTQWYATWDGRGFILDDECSQGSNTRWPQIATCEGVWVGLGGSKGACVLHQQVAHPFSWETWIQLGRRK